MQNDWRLVIPCRQWLGMRGEFLRALLVPGLASATSSAPKARAAIILFLQGGLSHFESFDPKPDVPSEVRGRVWLHRHENPGRAVRGAPAATGAAGMHRFSIVRSAYHPTPDHIQAIHITLCGCELVGANIDFKNRNVSPAMGAVVAKMRGLCQGDLPGYVTIPHRDQLGRRLHYGDSGRPRLRSRGLRVCRRNDRTCPMRSPPTSPLIRRLGIPRRRTRGIAGEPGEACHARPVPSSRHQLADARCGRPCLRPQPGVGRPSPPLRRSWHGPRNHPRPSPRRVRRALHARQSVLDQVKGQDWDTHEKNFHLMKNELLPPLDRAVSTLLDDLHCGLLDTTLVAILTDFGHAASTATPAATTGPMFSR